MKLQFLQKTALLCAGAAFALSAVSARADDPKPSDDSTHPTTHHRHTNNNPHPNSENISGSAQSVTTGAQSERKGGNTIPTKDGRNSKYAASNVTGGSTGEEHAVLTGSQIPRRYNRQAYGTNTSVNTSVYDKNDIRLQSTNNVGDALRSVPGLNVLGSR